MNCAKCGRELSPGELICPYCTGTEDEKTKRVHPMVGIERQRNANIHESAVKGESFSMSRFESSANGDVPANSNGWQSVREIEEFEHRRKQGGVRQETERVSMAAQTGGAVPPGQRMRSDSEHPQVENPTHRALSEENPPYGMQPPGEAYANSYNSFPEAPAAFARRSSGKKKWIVIMCAVLVLAVAAAVAAYALLFSKPDRSAESEKSISQSQSEKSTASSVESKSSQNADSGKKKSKKSSTPVYQIGETWEVSDQWRITINNVTETEDRVEYIDADPEAVYVIEYTVENLGYDNDQTDGLYFMLSSGSIVDCEGEMGYEYGSFSLVSQDQWVSAVPIGARHLVQESVGIKNPGDFTIHVSEIRTDKENVKEKAIFECKVNADEDSEGEESGTGDTGVDAEAVSA